MNSSGFTYEAYGKTILEIMNEYNSKTNYISRSKKQRKLMTLAFVGLIGTYYGWMIIT